MYIRNISRVIFCLIIFKIVVLGYIKIDLIFDEVGVVKM